MDIKQKRQEIENALEDWRISLAYDTLDRDEEYQNLLKRLTELGVGIIDKEAEPYKYVDSETGVIYGQCSRYYPLLEE